MVFAFWRVHRLALLVTLISALSYFLLSYVVEREQTFALIGSFLVASAGFLVLMNQEKGNFSFLVVVGILFRIIFLLSYPELSQDFYRFIWDGHLLKLGHNPYLSSPDELMPVLGDLIPNAQKLHAGMGELSARHFSNYPPANQVLFALSAWLGGQSLLASVVVLRVIIMAADVFVLFTLREILRRLSISTHQAFWYFLNPLVIIELTGNLHFEGVMIALFAGSLMLLVKGNTLGAGLLYSLSIGLKLVPLLFLPLFLTYPRFRQTVVFYLVVGAGLTALVLPFSTPESAAHYGETLSLWFSNFRFNAGIFGLANSMAVDYFGARPWEFIEWWGKGGAAATIIFSLFLVLHRRRRSFVQLTQAMLVLLSFYFLISSTVHPWYLVFLVFLGVFGRLKYPLVWSVLVVLSYSAYRNPDYKEYDLLIAVEYVLLFATLIYDYVTFRKFDGKFNLPASPASEKF